MQTFTLIFTLIYMPVFNDQIVKIQNGNAENKSSVSTETSLI